MAKGRGKEEESGESAEEEGDNGTPGRSDPTTLFANIKESLGGQDEVSILKSSFQQATLIGLLSVLLVTLISAAIFSNMTISAVGGIKFKKMGSSTITRNSNVLGLYHVKMPQSHPAISDAEGNTPSKAPRIGDTGEAYFLRYYVVPSEVISVEQEKNQGEDGVLSDSRSSSRNLSESGTRTVLMRPRRRMFITPRAVAKELLDSTKQEIVSPLVERWTGRVEKVKGLLLPNDSRGETAALISSHGSSPNNILGINAKDDTMEKSSESKSHTMLHVIRDNTPQLPRVPKPAGKSVCPTSLFCHFTLPATDEKSGVACANYCGRCFESSAELKRAIRNYLEDPSHTSEVANIYGWPIKNWCMTLISDFSYAFANSDFNEDIGQWDLSSATTVSHMFHGAKHFNQPLQKWDISKVTDMRYFLADASSFNQPLNGLDVSNVNTMKALFLGASKFNHNLNQWQTGKVKDMGSLFEDAISYSSDISTWNVANCKTFERAFKDALSFNSDISQWKTEDCHDFSNMFHGASKFNQDINSWSVSKATSMKGMFQGARSYNQDMDSWTIRRVRDLSFIFKDASKFNGNITSWQVSQVTNLESAFQGASSFEQNITTWRPYTGNRKQMFEGATKFERLYKDELYIAWAHRFNQNSLMFGEKDDSNLETKKTLLQVWGIVRNSTNFTAAADAFKDKAWVKN